MRFRKFLKIIQVVNQGIVIALRQPRLQEMKKDDWASWGAFLS